MLNVVACLVFGVLCGPAVTRWAARTAGSSTTGRGRILLAALWISTASAVVISRQTGLLAALPWLWAVPFAVGLGFIDLDSQRLPMSWLAPMASGGLVLFLVAVGLHTQWPVLVRAVLAALASFSAALVPQLVSGAGLGFGDTKLCGVIGLYCGSIGWSSVMAALAIGFVLNGLIAVYLMQVHRWRRSSRFAAGPGLMAGALIAVMLA